MTHPENRTLSRDPVDYTCSAASHFGPLLGAGPSGLHFSLGGSYTSGERGRRNICASARSEFVASCKFLVGNSFGCHMGADNSAVLFALADSPDHDAGTLPVGSLDLPLRQGVILCLTVKGSRYRVDRVRADVFHAPTVGVFRGPSTRSGYLHSQRFTTWKRLERRCYG